ncbi:MAG: DUF4240 domain-containing protein [Gemmataceae bacterium]|nr:DUF4240 domain-containing protein [Gemmataceae bacterium]
MDWDRFWEIVAGLGPDPGVALRRLKWFEVVAFRVRLDEAMAAADTPDLRAAAALVQGSGLPGALRDFRAWLVGRGQDVYDAALLDPDSLADGLDGDPVDDGGLPDATVRAYEALTGMSDFYEQVRQLRGGDPPAPPADPWYFDEADARHRFPRLAAPYPPPPPVEDAE